MYIPKVAYLGCMIPILLISIICLIYYIIHRKNRGYYYYHFNQNIFLLIASLLITAILLPFLLGYSLACIYYMISAGLIKTYLVFVIFIGILPVVPFIMLIWLIIKIYNSFKMKRELDENYDKLKVVEE